MEICSDMCCGSGWRWYDDEFHAACVWDADDDVTPEKVCAWCEERNDLFILLTDKENINIFLCKQSYLLEQNTRHTQHTHLPSTIHPTESFPSSFWYTRHLPFFEFQYYWNWNFFSSFLSIQYRNDVRISLPPCSQSSGRVSYPIKISSLFFPKCKNGNISSAKAKS